MTWLDPRALTFSLKANTQLKIDVSSSQIVRAAPSRLFDKNPITASGVYGSTCNTRWSGKEFWVFSPLPVPTFPFLCPIFPKLKLFSRAWLESSLLYTSRHWS